ncbi:flagellar hook-basal body protein [Piscibacillus halophilus]|uniref:Flagellar basal-body rod protein FlgG n=1 Tax=Piscibacillus halophilus TaxID=571933 RepID=A0A1H9KJ66_9BACI|nr:flagellar hook-basal body protein [Piscibacillus halophilus]SEQ99119.1 flagellar basal-body rod protein FlgG [Piscibacillus halophilus]
MRNMLNAATTMNQLQQRMDLTSNNLANSNTHGYKSKSAQFSSLLFQQVNNLNNGDPDAPRLTPDGIRVGSGAKMGHTNTNMNVGTIQETGRALDVATQDSERFFVVNAPLDNGQTEERYTKAGNFYLQPVNGNEQVMLTTGEGLPVQGQNGPIILDSDFDEITITENGGVQVDRNGNRQIEATLQLVDIDQPRALEATGDNLFRIDEAGLGVPAEQLLAEVDPQEANLMTGALESSNVDIGKELTDLLESQRAYSFNSRSISIGDQMMGLIGSMRS